MTGILSIQTISAKHVTAFHIEFLLSILPFLDGFAATIKL